MVATADSPDAMYVGGPDNTKNVPVPEKLSNQGQVRCEPRTIFESEVAIGAASEYRHKVAQLGVLLDLELGAH